MKTKKMMGIFLSLGMFLAFFGAGISKDTIVESKWAVTPPTIDGGIADWSGDTLVPDKSHQIEYGIRNDAKDLYILLMFKDPKFLSSVERTGMTVYLNAQGKKSKDFGIRFLRKNITADQLIATLEKAGETLTPERKAEIKQRPMYQMFDVAIVNKKGDEVKIEAQPGTIEPASFRPGRDGKTMIYEFRIPLAAKTVTPFGIGAESGKNIKIGFEWGGMTKEERNARLAGLGEMRATAGSVGDVTDKEGTSVQEPGGPGFDSVMRGPKKYDFWADVKLAVNQ